MSDADASPAGCRWLNRAIQVQRSPWAGHDEALRWPRDSYPEVFAMKRPATAFVLALVSLVLCPILVFIEFTAWFGAAMVANEDANPVWAKVLSFVFVGLIALLALALPVLAISSGRKARAATKSAGTGGSGLATVAVVIGVIVLAGVLAAQVYTLISAFG